VSSFSSEGLPRPEEFPVGSAERRAAARALLDLREKGARRIQLILDMANRQRRGRAVASGQDGSLMRTVCLSRGASEETKRLLFATP